MNYEEKSKLLNRAQAAKSALIEIRQNKLYVGRLAGHHDLRHMQKSLCSTAQILFDTAIAAQAANLLDEYLAACAAAGIDPDNVD